MNTLNPFSKKVLSEIADGTRDRNGRKKVSMEKVNAKRNAQREAYQAALNAAPMSSKVADKVFGKKAKQEITYPQAEKMCDIAFSQWVRLKSADEKGIVRCFICMIPMRWERSVLMHFQSRTCLPIQWDETANQAGCRHCNGKELGDRVSFAFRLDAKFGKGTAEALTIKSKEQHKYSTIELLEKAREYRELIVDIREREPGKFKQ